MAVAQVLSSSEADRAPSSKGQEKKDTENWGKLIFQLKQKHPEQGTASACMDLRAGTNQALAVSNQSNF
jgi:hypothetical protein